MKKRALSILLLTVILSVQIFTSTGLVYADPDDPGNEGSTPTEEPPPTPAPTEEPTPTDKPTGEVEISAKPAGTNYKEYNGKYFVSARTNVYMSYEVKVDGYKGANLAIVETINGEKQKAIDISEIERGKRVTRDGAKKDTGQKLEFKYHVINKDTNEKIDQGATVNVDPIHTDFDVSYTADKSGSVFMNDSVTFTLIVESKSNVPVENIIVVDKDLGQLGTIDSLAPGVKVTIRKTIKMEKGTEGVIGLNYTDPLGVRDGEKRIETNTVNLNVSNAARSSGISIKAAPANNAISGETTMDITLVIKNIGNTNLRNIKVFDWNGDTVYSSQGVLTPGDELSRNLSARVSPDKTYNVRVEGEGDEGAKAVGNDQFILSKLEPRVEILRDIPTGIVAGQPFEIRYTIRNVGNVDIKNILIEEPEMGDVAIIDELLAGDETIETQEFTIEDNVVSQTKLKAVDSLSGTAYEYSASGITINVQESGVKHQLAMVLHANVEELENPGTIQMECIVKNTGTEALSNLKFTLMDREMTIREIIVLEPGEEQRLEITPFRMEETESFRVVVQGYGEDNDLFTAESDTLTITVVNPGKVRNTNVLKTILIVIALLCLAIIGTLVYMSRDQIKKWFKKIRKTA